MALAFLLQRRIMPARTADSVVALSINRDFAAK